MVDFNQIGQSVNIEKIRNMQIGFTQDWVMEKNIPRKLEEGNNIYRDTKLMGEIMNSERQAPTHRLRKKEREREKERQRQRKKEREKERKTKRERNIDIERKIDR